jgi:hypothetical protein
MVSAVRHGQALRAVARAYGVSLSTVQYWVAHAAGRRLDRVDFASQPRGPRQPSRTPMEIEDLILQTRRRLREEGVLGEYGAAAVRAELLSENVVDVPCVRTIHRIFERRGALDGQHRVRRPAPPVGWYLPQVAGRKADIDEFDIIEGLVIRNGPQVEVLTALSALGGLSGAWPQTSMRTVSVRQILISHWREFGLPAYAQFDNDTRFHGAHYPDAISSVSRICLSLGVVPVFVPPREMGFQAAIESFNGRWQAKVWRRFEHSSLLALSERSDRYIAAHRSRCRVRQEAAPVRRAFPDDWCLDLQQRPQGELIFLRRTNEHGSVQVLGHGFVVAHTWPHRLVRCEVDLNSDMIRFYALRRRAPGDQPLLNEAAYGTPTKTFLG